MPAANLAVVPISPTMSFSDHYYWGPLVNPDKSPAPLLEQLCLGIAQLMVSAIAILISQTATDNSH